VALMTARSIDFHAINRAAVPALPVLLRRWLPDGKRRGSRWIARNPTRNDRTAGSFSVDLRSGKWGEFSKTAPASGGDVVSLYAYLRGIRQVDAARELVHLLRINS
jgi:hypothetical protein